MWFNLKNTLWFLSWLKTSGVNWAKKRCNLIFKWRTSKVQPVCLWQGTQAEHCKVHGNEIFSLQWMNSLKMQWQFDGRWSSRLGSQCIYFQACPISMSYYAIFFKDLSSPHLILWASPCKCSSVSKPTSPAGENIHHRSVRRLATRTSHQARQVAKLQSARGAVQPLLLSRRRPFSKLAVYPGLAVGRSALSLGGRACIQDSVTEPSFALWKRIPPVCRLALLQSPNSKPQATKPNLKLA